MSRILVVVPHADELAFHVGGTIAHMVQDGHDVIQVVLTPGSGASFTHDRTWVTQKLQEEIRRSAEVLKLKDVILWDFPDGRLYEALVPEVEERLVALVRHLRIDTIFGFDPSATQDFHPDQVTSGKATWSAAYYSGFPLSHRHHSSIGLTPSMVVEQYYFSYHPIAEKLRVVDITETIEVKIEAVMAFQSQVEWCADVAIAESLAMGGDGGEIDRANYGLTLADQIRSEAAERAARDEFEFAEAFRYIGPGTSQLT